MFGFAMLVDGLPGWTHDFLLLGLSYNIHFSLQVTILCKILCNFVLFLELRNQGESSIVASVFVFRSELMRDPTTCESFPAVLGDRKRLIVLFQAQVPIGFGKNSRPKCSPIPRLLLFLVDQGVRDRGRNFPLKLLEPFFTRAVRYSILAQSRRNHFFRLNNFF